MRVLAATLALLAASSVQAQGIDGHGEVPPAFDPNPRAPLTVQAPWASPQGAWSALGMVEFADAPVVQYRQTAPDTIDEILLLDNVISLDLAGRYAIFDRFGVAVALPLFLGASGELGGGPALGDLHLWLPIGVVLPELRTGRGFGLSVVPEITLPTGARARFLGSRTLGLELSGVTGYSFGPVSADLNVGLSVSGSSELASQRVGGGALVGGFGFGVHPSDTWSLHLEGRAHAALDGATGVADTPDGSGASVGSPNELFLTFKSDLPGKAWGAAGVGRGTNSGIGAARLRAFLGAGLAYTPEEAGSAVLHGVALTAVDPRGVPVADATVSVGDKVVGVTAADGTFALQDPNWKKGIELRGPGHAATAVDEPTEGVDSVRVVMGWVPVPVPIRVQDQQGRKVVATVTATRADGVAAASLQFMPDDTALEPGDWTLRFEAAGFGAQERAITVESGGRAPAEVEVVLLEDLGPAVMVLSLTDPESVPVSGAQVLVDGQPLGSTGAGGVVRIEGLQVGAHALAVQHENFTRSEEPELQLAQGDNPVVLVLRRVPGSVKVVARGPAGKPIVDAVVRFDGPRRLAPTPLGDRGERIQALGPGDWTLTVTSAEFGVQQRAIAVPPDSWELITVEIVLQPGEQGNAVLALDVVDADGHPIEGITIRLDDKNLGTTSTGGALRLLGLATGSRVLRVEGEHFRPVEPAEIFLHEGLQQRVVALDWEAGTVRVTARQAEGPVGDAVLRWIGAQTLPPAPLGASGESYFQLEQGSWTALATSELWGLQQAEVEIPPDSRSLQAVDLMMSRDEGGLADLSLRVVDPDGRPVAGAAVLLDGALVGRTTNAGSLTLKHLSVGRRDLEVRTELTLPASERLRLLVGEQSTEVVLDWAPGAARVIVVSDGEPVRDAVVRMIGPSDIAPSPVDARGERVFALAPGSWQAVAISAEAGIAQGTVDIAEDQVGMALLTLDISPGVAGTSSLLVRVMDPDGNPIEGALIGLGSDEVGTTGVGGALLAEGLPPGRVAVRATHPAFTSAGEVEAVLEVGSQERILILEWKPGKLAVSAKDAAGNPIDARVQLVGPVDQSPIALGADGEETVALRPGIWQVIASTDSLGPARAEVQVSARTPARADLVLQASRVAMTREAVVIKEQVQFEFGQAKMIGHSGRILDEVANAIVGNPGIIKVEVQGHADAIGEIAYNQALSQQRAEAVRSALADRGVPTEKLVARGYGTQRPIADNETEEGRAKNRRVEFDIVEQVTSEAPSAPEQAPE